MASGVLLQFFKFLGTQGQLTLAQLKALITVAQMAMAKIVTMQLNESFSLSCTATNPSFLVSQ